MPSNLVIDLSHWNNVRSFTEVWKSGIIGVFNKFSQGVSYKDPSYAQRFTQATATHLLFGRYHFADSTDVSRQVTNFLTGWTPDEALALDWEDNGGDTLTLDGVVEFVNRVFEQTGVLPLLYSGNTLKDVLKGKPEPRLKDVRLWVAHYTVGKPVLPPGWDAYWLWQNTDKGTCPGIDGDVDLDQFQGTIQQLRDGWVTRAVPVKIITPPVSQDTESVTISVTVPKGAVVDVSVAGPVTVNYT